MNKHEMGASSLQAKMHTSEPSAKAATNARKHTHNQACNMMLTQIMKWEPVLAWKGKARDIESGVSTCYVMLMLCYVMRSHLMLC